MQQREVNSPPITLRRRDVIFAGAAAAGTALLASAVPAAADDPYGYFRHGVASGDPLPDRVLLWTRVTPTEDSTPGSGTGPEVSVRWEVAEDADFQNVIASGSEHTGPDSDHTVKTDATELSPGQWYFYRFTLDGTHSPVGRTRTAPEEAATPDELRFGVVSCSNYQGGHFSAYRHLAERGDLDAIVHLGDYIYEYGNGDDSYGDVRLHQPAHEMVTLADYRKRHAQYKTDPDLRAAHAACPWIITWDDHEAANDAHRDGAENHQPDTEGTWTARRAAAFQAYREWMPIRFGMGDTIHRRVRFGRLAEFTMLDLRSYRSEQADWSTIGDIDDSDRTMTGLSQLEFLRDSLTDPDVSWKLIGNPVMFAPLTVPALPNDIGTALSELTGVYPTDGLPLNFDDWNGYQYERRQLIDYMTANEVRNAVFLTGDIHTSWAQDIPVDAGTYPLTDSVATEFVVPSVTSDNIDDILGVPPRTVSPAAETALMLANRHTKWVELDSHGYGILDVTADRTQMDWYFLTDRKDPTSTATHAVSFSVSDGVPHVSRVPLSV